MQLFGCETFLDFEFFQVQLESCHIGAAPNSALWLIGFKTAKGWLMGGQGSFYYVSTELLNCPLTPTYLIKLPVSSFVSPLCFS